MTLQEADSEAVGDTGERYTWVPFHGGVALNGVRGTKLWRMVHSHYTVCLLHNGRADWSYRRRSFSVAPEALYVCEPGEIHVTCRVHSPSDFTVFFVEPGTMASLSAAQGGPTEPHFSAGGVGHRPLWQAFRQLTADLLVAPPEAFEQGLSLGLTNLLTLGEERVWEPGVSERMLQRAREAIRARFFADPTQVIRLAPIAEELGLSYFTLVRSFSKRYSVPPYQFVSALRAQHTLASLKAGPTPTCATLTALAQCCGYSDCAHMTRSLRRYFGLTPTALANQLNPGWLKARGRAFAS